MTIKDKKDKPIINDAAKAKFTETFNSLALTPKIISLPDPVSGFSWTYNDNDAVWEVKNNLFYKKFELNKVSLKVSEIDSQAFDFKVYKKFLQENTEEKNRPKIELKYLGDRLKRFLPFNEPFNKPKFHNEFIAWSGQWSEENTSELSKSGIEWQNVLIRKRFQSLLKISELSNP